VFSAAADLATVTATSTITTITLTRIPIITTDNSFRETLSSHPPSWRHSGEDTTFRRSECHLSEVSVSAAPDFCASEEVRDSAVGRARYFRVSTVITAAEEEDFRAFSLSVPATDFLPDWDRWEACRRRQSLLTGKKWQPKSKFELHLRYNKSFFLFELIWVCLPTYKRKRGTWLTY